jgi:hypothetical protein
MKEQCICDRFCFNLGNIASEMHEMLKRAFTDNSMGKTETSEHSGLVIAPWVTQIKMCKIVSED